MENYRFFIVYLQLCQIRKFVATVSMVMSMGLIMIVPNNKNNPTGGIHDASCHVDCCYGTETTGRMLQQLAKEQPAYHVVAVAKARYAVMHLKRNRSST